jgi:TonB family protein
MLQAPVIHLFQPIYPQEARDRKIVGTALVKVLVNVRTGDVEGACLVEGNEIFQGAATEAARKAKFAPNWGGNQYISSRYEYVEGNITYNFVAQ